MMFFIFMWNLMNVHSFISRDTYNLLLKDSEDYKIDLVIDEDDYEMIDKNQLKDFIIDNRQFNEFDKFVRTEYKKHERFSINIVNSNKNLTTSAPPKTTVPHTHSPVKTAHKEHHTTHTIKKREITKTDPEYNYNDLINEYYDVKAASQNSSEAPDYGLIYSLKRIFFLCHTMNNCNRSIGFQAIKSLVNDYNSQQRLTKEVAMRMWRIIQIWFLVYLVLAVPLWCTRGWCCCCLCCKFFKPRQTIEEAKKYLMLNPPGVFKTKNGVVLYDPTEREKETYEEFEHLIKAL